MGDPVTLQGCNAVEDFVWDRHASIGEERPSQAPRWSSLNLTYLVERAGVNPEKTAIVCEGEARTYAEFRDLHRRVANALRECGVQRLERVAITTRNCLQYLEIELGIAGAGAIMVPLSWRLSPAERVNLLRRSQTKVVFAEASFVPEIVAARKAGELPDLRLVVALGEAAEASGPADGPADLGYAELCASAPGTPSPVAAELDEPHEIIYTSGTTGVPKGAVWTHGTVLWNSIEQVMDYGLRPDHSTYVALDLNYIGGRHDFTWPILHQGGTVHIRRSGGFDAREAVTYIESHRISHVLWVPTMLYDVLRVPDLADIDTGSLEMIMCGGAPLSQEIIERAQKAFPNTNFVQVYGLTEGGGTVTFVPPEYAVSKIGSAGKASMHNEIRVVDEGGEPLPPHETGEIIVKGPSVTAGYWDNPQATAEAVRDGWLFTGDLGYLDEDGFLFVAGRKKEMIISGGMNIYPTDVEHVLREHPFVHDVAVIGLPDEKWGETVCAVVQPSPGTATGEEEIARELIAYCRERLASFKKPSVVKTIDEFPRTISGKVKKYELRELFAGAGSG
ncbi:MAG: AMP-binding protein [Streptosporangiales bacterium]|nr:AMP-binding protein [Streptosporangiales bacterium]